MRTLLLAAGVAGVGLVTALGTALAATDTNPRNTAPSTVIEVAR